MHLGAGLSVGLTGLAAGYAIGIVGDMVSLSITDVLVNNLICGQGVRSYMLQSRIFVGMVLILIFGEVLGLYGYDLFPYTGCDFGLTHVRLIVALILNTGTN